MKIVLTWVYMILYFQTTPISKKLQRSQERSSTLQKKKKKVHQSISYLVPQARGTLNFYRIGNVLIVKQSLFWIAHDKISICTSHDQRKTTSYKLAFKIFYKWFLQSVFHLWSIVTQDCTLCKLVGEAWNAIHELHLWVYFNYMNNQIADDYIQSKFVKRKTRDGVTSYEALALLYKCAISTYTCQHLYNKLQFPMIILFYNPRFLLQKSNLSSQQSYYFA